MQNPFPVHQPPHVRNKNETPIRVTFTNLGTGLGLVVFGLGLITVFCSRSWSRTLWSRSWLWTHYVLVALISLLIGSPLRAFQ